MYDETTHPASVLLWGSLPVKSPPTYFLVRCSCGFSKLVLKKKQSQGASIINRKSEHRDGKSGATTGSPPQEVAAATADDMGDGRFLQRLLAIQLTEGPRDDIQDALGLRDGGGPDEEG